MESEPSPCSTSTPLRRPSRPASAPLNRGSSSGRLSRLRAKSMSSRTLVGREKPLEASTAFLRAWKAQCAESRSWISVRRYGLPTSSPDACAAAASAEPRVARAELDLREVLHQARLDGAVVAHRAAPIRQIL